MGAAGKDAKFLEYHRDARSAGLRIGAYHFFRPDSPGEAQAKHFLNTINGLGSYFLKAVDVETPANYPDPIDRDAYAQELANFVSYFYTHTANEHPAIYTSKGEWAKLVGTQHDALFAQCDLWVANYTTAASPAMPRCWTEWKLWQYSSAGAVDGVIGRVDMNRWRHEAVAPETFTLLFPIKAPAGCQIVLTSRFGTPRDYDGDGVKDDLHEGVDWAPIGNACLPDVVAGADGVVESVRTIGAYGNRIKLKHEYGGDTYYTWYAHLSRMDVQAGDTVRRGQTIGVMGNTGNSTGNHLHLNLQWIGHGLDGYVIDDAVDPLPYIVYE